MPSRVAEYLAVEDVVSGLDLVSRLAADLMGTPLAVISLVCADQVRFISRAGPALPDYPLREGLCASCVAHKAPWTITDAATDVRTADHVHVREYGVRFYCGLPIVTDDGSCLGALAVMDQHARCLTPHQMLVLKRLSGVVMAMLEECRSSNAARESYRAELAQREILEDHIRGLMREVTHRSKNMLAVILAFMRQSTHEGQSLSDYRGRLIARIDGLARTHDLIAADEWRGADLDQLIASQLRPYVVDGQQLRYIGPRVSILPAAAQHLGMALQELAANSVRLGALSVENGAVSVSWKLTDHPPCFRLFWREHGGPQVASPSEAGFGHILLEPIVSQAMDGLGRLSFTPAGIGWQLEVPLDNVVANAASFATAKCG